MAGLCAAVRAVELGARCLVFEKGTRAGGSMVHSSGVVRRLGTPLPAVPTVLATGGFAASPGLVPRHIWPAAPLRRRGGPWSSGEGLERAVAAGGSLGGGMAEFYGRNMPDAPLDTGGFATGGYASGLAQALVLGLAAAEAALS